MNLLAGELTNITFCPPLPLARPVQQSQGARHCVEELISDVPRIQALDPLLRAGTSGDAHVCVCLPVALAWGQAQAVVMVYEDMAH